MASNMNNLTGSLKDAHAENVRLEKILSEKRRNRLQMEEKLEKINARLGEAQDKYNKENEAFKVEQHKVNQTQAQNDRIEQSNEEKRQRIQKMAEEIDKLQQQRINNQITPFTEALSRISNNLRKAKDDYSQDNLSKTLDAAKKVEEELRSQSVKYDREIIAVKSELDGLNIDGSEMVYDGIDRDMIMKILNEQLQVYQSELDRLKQSHDDGAEHTPMMEQRTENTRMMEQLVI